MANLLLHQLEDIDAENETVLLPSTETDGPTGLDVLRVAGNELPVPVCSWGCSLKPARHPLGRQRAYRQNGPEATEQLYREIAPTFLEDKEMVEAQQKRLDEFGDQGLVDIASDANRMHMRRIAERLIAAEQSTAAVQ